MSEIAMPDKLESRHLFDIGLRLRPPYQIGETPAGDRNVVTIASGSFSGERLRGSIVPEACSDLLLRRADGTFRQDVRLLLRTHDEALIVMTYAGVRNGDYFRVVPFFETGATQYAWLNDIVCVATGSRKVDSTAYRVFEIL
ncbi:MAG TPA: DUF3237 domain-containing protein [Candidatus Tumulicola sp.]|jgi:hypothetical protein